MCELLVWVHDREDGGNPDHDAVKYRRGDVIVAMPDGHPWTETEKRHPSWIVLKVPGMSLVEGESLTHPEPEEVGRRLFHQCLFNLDLDHLEAHPVIKSIMARAQACVNLPVEIVDADHLRTIKRRKPPAADPRIIGEHKPANVIG